MNHYPYSSTFNANPKKNNFSMGLKVFSTVLLGFSFVLHGQIKEEKLILNRKREPEVKRIEKKKSSVATVKKYPPQSKKVEDSLNLRYQIKDVAAASDFKTSTLERTDISPKFTNDQYKNYVRFGMGNYGKILGDANISTSLDSNFEVGADVHFLSTTGLKKLYDWDSQSTKSNVAAFLNHYGEKGRLNVTAEYGLHNYNYYGIYAFPDFPIIQNVDVQQKVNEMGVRGYYELYNDDIFKNISLKTNFLSDHFGAKENSVEGMINLSSFRQKITDQVDMKMDWIIASKGQDTRFDLLDKNRAQHTIVEAVPKFQFFYDKASLTLSSHFTLLNSKMENAMMPTWEEKFKFYWFPKAELSYKADDAYQFYTGIDGGFQLNTYSELLKENPFLVSDQILLPTKTKYEVYFGMKGDFNQELKYDVSAGFSKKENILFYKALPILDNIYTLNRSAYNFANVFTTAYDNGTVSHIKAQLTYFPIQNLSLDAEINYQKYNLDHTAQIYYKPLVMASFGAKYSMLNQKLQLGFKGILGSDSYTNSFAVQQSPTSLSLYEVTEDKNDKIGGYADINLSAEYKVHKNFSIFALGNNLLNTHYQTFKGYQVLGAQVTAGVKIAF